MERQQKDFSVLMEEVKHLRGERKEWQRSLVDLLRQMQTMGASIEG